MVGVLTGGQSPHLGRRDEERARLGLMIGGQVDGGFAFPPLPRADAKGHARPFAQNADEAKRAGRIPVRHAGEDVEGKDDQAVACQHGKRFGKGAMRGRAAPAQVGVIEHGQVVVDEAGTVDEFERGSGSIRQGGPIVPAGQRDRCQDRGADARAAGGGGMGQRGRQATRRGSGLADTDSRGNRGLDAGGQGHRRILRSEHGNVI